MDGLDITPLPRRSKPPAKAGPAQHLNLLARSRAREVAVMNGKSQPKWVADEIALRNAAREELADPPEWVRRSNAKPRGAVSNDEIIVKSGLHEATAASETQRPVLKSAGGMVGTPEGLVITANNNALTIAFDIIDRNWKPVPVPRGKNPVIPEWQNLDITRDNAHQYFNGADINVGAIMGPRSGGLTDVDLDCIEAVKLAPHFLPETHSIYGRLGKRKSHWLYTCNDPDAKAGKKWFDEDKKVIVDLRMGGGGKGAQSVMPGSTHPSGEKYEWDKDGALGAFPCATLKTRCVTIAVGTVLMRHWPDESGRHDAALGVGGFLARAGWTPSDIDHFMDAICRETDGTEWAHDHARPGKQLKPSTAVEKPAAFRG